MALFLSGGGDPPLTIAVDEAFAAAVAARLVIYIPTALTGTALFDGAEDWFSQTYRPLGVTSVDTWRELDGRSLLGRENLGGVHLGGGNTYLLLRELRRTGLDLELRALIDRGVHVYGGSAGAIVLGRDVTTSDLGGDERVDGLADFAGLDVLSGWSVSCHYTRDHDPFLRRWTSGSSHSKALLLCEDAGVVVEGDQLRVLGQSGAGLQQGSTVDWVTAGAHHWPPQLGAPDDPASPDAGTKVP